MISYAQNHEDVLLQRFFQGDAPQFYVDVGAGHPTYHSVTKHFYDSGWSGLNIEPRSKLFDRLCDERTRDLNHHGPIAQQGGEMTFYEVDVVNDASEDCGGLSTLDSELAQKYRGEGCAVVEHHLQASTLTELFERFNIAQIGFLKIDVEGYEWQVVQSLDWNRWRPRVVVTESTIPTSAVVCDEETTKFLTRLNYTPAHFDGLNRYFVRSEDSDRLPRLAAPVNVLDDYISHHVWELMQAQSKSQEYIANIEQLHRSRIEDHQHQLSQLNQSFAHTNHLFHELAEQYNDLNARLNQLNIEREQLTIASKWQLTTIEQQARQLDEFHQIIEQQSHSLADSEMRCQELAMLADRYYQSAERRTIRGRVNQMRKRLTGLVRPKATSIVAAKSPEPSLRRAA